jgi:L,D-transpeptidase ErfK/SrfK
MKLKKITLMNNAVLILSFLLVILQFDQAAAEKYVIFNNHSLDQLLANDELTVVGNIRFARANKNETLIDVARRFNLGYDEIVKANSNINRWVPDPNARVILPTQYVLPDAPRDGIVLNIAELRLYYFPKTSENELPTVYTYPVSIGRLDWRTPLGKTRVVRKDKNPPWYPTDSIRREHAAEGDILPKFIKGGDPENPLGNYALRLAIPSYLIHGTDQRKANGIGMQVTHGCVRLYPEDVEDLYNLVGVNTPVYIVDQPIKIGVKNNAIFLEVHTPLEEDGHRVEIPEEEIYSLLERKVKSSFRVNRRLVSRLAKIGDGVPMVIGSLTD